MGVNQSKELSIKDLVNGLRHNLVDDTLNTEFQKCLYNLPNHPIKTMNSLSSYNILSDNTIISLLTTADHLRVPVDNTVIEWCDLDKDTEELPIYDINNIDDEVDEIYFATQEPDAERRLFNNCEWYVIGKMKTHIYFTLYIYAPQLVETFKNQHNPPKRNLTFYKDIRNIRETKHYERFRRNYFNNFFSYMASL